MRNKDLRFLLVRKIIVQKRENFECDLAFQRVKSQGDGLKKIIIFTLIF